MPEVHHISAVALLALYVLDAAALFLRLPQGSRLAAEPKGGV